MNLLIKLIFFVLFTTLMSSCTPTPTRTAVWEKTYIDDIYQFLVSDDGSNLVFIGIKYDYLFSNNDELKNVLLWKDRQILHVDFEEKFIITDSNKVLGNYSLFCNSANLNPDQIHWLENNGFNKSLSTDSNIIYVKKTSINGKRYQSNQIIKPEINEYSNLSQPYEITFKESYEANLYSSNKNHTTGFSRSSPSTSHHDPGFRYEEIIWIAISIPLMPLYLPALMSDPID
jgi:hypothetical protein